MATEKDIELKEKRRPGRKPMTPEERETAAADRAAQKAKAANLKPDVFIQYGGNEIDIGELTEAAKADFRAAKKRTLVTDLKLYVKPEEHMAYYVINGKHEGKISF